MEDYLVAVKSLSGLYSEIHTCDDHYLSRFEFDDTSFLLSLVVTNIRTVYWEDSFSFARLNKLVSKVFNCDALVVQSFTNLYPETKSRTEQ
jgi:hypothetical protein